MLRSILISFCVLFCFVLNSQNDVSFFKSVPKIDQNTPGWAQEMYKLDANVKKVLQEYNQYYNKNNFKKTIHTQNFKHWIRIVEPLMIEDGTIKQPSKKETDAFAKRIKTKRNASKKSSPNWVSIGPFETYKNGTTTPLSNHANLYSIDQSLSNTDILIAGTESGGVFKTTDKADTWSLISEDEVFSNGITAVKIDPKDNNTYLISANSRIYKTTDGGGTWTEELFMDGSAYEIKFDPANNNHIYVLGSKGLFESSDNGNTWITVFTDECWDLDYHPTNSSIVYLLKTNPSLNKTEFYKSTNGGTNWYAVTSGWYIPENSSQSDNKGGKIAVSLDDPNRVYACLIGDSKANDNGWIGLYRSNNSGSSWYLPSGQIGSPYQTQNTMPWNPAAYNSGYHQGFYNFDCEASPNDADLVWFGTVRLNESADGGTSYISIGGANTQRLSDVHADIQDIEVLGSDVWVASDGGLNYSNDDLNSHESKKYGIIGSNFWGFGSGWNEDVLVGGKYHNGNTAYYQSYGQGYSHNVGGVEEATGYVNPLENRKVYFNEYWAGGMKKREIADVLGGSNTLLATYGLVPNESYSESSSSGYYFDPRYADHIYAGQDSVIYKSTNGGNSFDVLHDFGVTGNVFEIAISRKNPDVIYAVFQPGAGYWDWCEIHRTTDGGDSWTKLSDVPSNSRWRLEMALNHENENEIWVSANNGDNGQKIYRSTDGGTSWTNMTSSVLDDENIKDIYHQGASGGYVYAASATGFFYYDPASATWVNHSTGLPLITNALKLAPFYRDGLIRLATKGRGIWETDLVVDSDPIAQPMSFTDTVRCSRDTVLFDSYSIINHAGASWAWSFSPAPAYVSNTNSRNPKVVFGQDGSYDVSLLITDANGNTSSKTINSMVTVNNECGADAFPGNAMECAASGDYTQLPNYNTTVTHMTMTAWVKPDGIQPEYSGIVMNDDDAAGINFRESNNTIAYHWPGGQWWWDSNMTVPAGEWSYVALVAEPTKMTLYVNGVPAVHNITLNPVNITTLKIGSYKAWGSRNFKGEIDEVCIWDRALTEDEIREWRHLTKEDIIGIDQNLIGYYQFNGNGNAVLDKVGLRHGNLSGGAATIPSTAAVGGGTSDIQTVNSPGSVSFGDTGLEIDFSSGSQPNGKLVVSRLDLMPTNPMNGNLNINAYWIVNNYGNNSFSTLNSMKFNDPNTNPSPSATLSNLKLWKRSSNEYQNNWSQSCSANAVTGGDNGVYTFGSSCGITSFSQFYIQDPCVFHRSIITDYLNGETVELATENSIDASNLINSGSDIKYESQCIELDFDFEVKKGAVFEALIGGCSN